MKYPGRINSHLFSISALVLFRSCPCSLYGGKQKVPSRVVNAARNYFYDSCSITPQSPVAGNPTLQSSYISFCCNLARAGLGKILELLESMPDMDAPRYTVSSVGHIGSDIPAPCVGHAVVAGAIGPRARRASQRSRAQLPPTQATARTATSIPVATAARISIATRELPKPWRQLPKPTFQFAGASFPSSDHTPRQRKSG